MRLKALLNQRRLMFLNVSVKRIINDHLVIYLIMDLYVRCWVVFRNWRAHTANLPLTFEIITVLLVLIVQLLFLRHRCRLGLRNTPLSVIGSRLIDDAHVVLQALLVATLLNSIVTLNISIARRPFVINHGQRRLLSILIWAIFFAYWCCRTGILDVFIQICGHERVPDGHSNIVKVRLTTCAVLRVLSVTSVHRFSASTHVLCRGHIV